MTTTTTDAHAPKQKVQDERIISLAREKARELLKAYMELFGKHDRQITEDPMPSIAWRHAKEAAIIACNLMIEGEYKWSHRYNLYTEAINQINNWQALPPQ